MSIIYIKDLTSALVPFDQLEIGILAAFIVSTAITTLLDFVLIYAIVKQRDIPIDSQFILNICVSDVLFSLAVLAFGVVHLVSGGWSTGVLGCQIDGAIILISVSSSILTLLYMTTHRYLIFIWRYHISQNLVYLIIGGTWILLALAAYLYLTSGYTDEGIALQASKYYCMVQFTTNDPRSLVLVYLVLFFLAFNMIFITYAYSAIVLKYMRLKRRAMLVAAGSLVTESSQTTMSPQEKLLIQKAMVFSGAYMIYWLPYIMKILIELATKEPVSFIYDCLCDVAVCSNPLLNALVLLKYDANIKNNVFELYSRVTRSQKSIKTGSDQSSGKDDKKDQIKPVNGIGNVLLVGGVDIDLSTRIIPK